MNSLASTLSPSIVSMICMDHAHVLSVFHQYRLGSSPSAKRALARTACLGLEIHAQLEEEIFYPALRAALPDDPNVAKSEPEHDEMRRLIAELRATDATDPAFDQTFMELMRDVIHHVADEETILLPAAERLFPERLGELGAQMTKRRVELAAPHAGELAVNSLQAASASTVLFATGALLAGSYMVKRAFSRHT